MDIDSGSSPDSTPSSKLQNASPSGSADRHPTSSTTTTTTAPLHSDSVPSAAGSVMAEHKEAVMAKDSPPDTHCRWGRTRKLRRVGKVGEDDDGNPLPGFEDVDDEQMAFCSESDFAIFIKQISSEIPLQRLVAVKRMIKSCHLWGEEAVLSVLPRVQQLSSDKEMVIRQAIAQVLGPTAKFLVETMSPFIYEFAADHHPIDFAAVDRVHSATSSSASSPAHKSPNSPSPSTSPSDSPNASASASAHSTTKAASATATASGRGQRVEGKVRAHHVIITELLPLIKEMLKDAMEVRQGAGSSLIVIAELLNKEQVYEHILKIVLHMAHDDSDDHKITALPLLGDLAPIVGSAVCKNYLSADLHALSQDNSFRVRKATVQYFGPICEQLGAKDAEECLLPIFLALCSDSIWSVRKGCVESFVDVSSSISSSKRVSLIPIMEQFLNDSSRWVRNTAYEVLGPFIASLSSEQIESDLLKYFTSIPHLSSAEADADCTNHCAFSFPAVVLTVGRARWSELEETYNILCRKTFKSRKTLACSLHEVAAILGTELAEKHLVSALEFFLKDIDDIRFGVVKNLWRMLKVLSPRLREEYLSVLWELAAESDVNWRFRLLLAEQLDELLHLYPAEVVRDQLLPLMLQLCQDRMADVRYAATFPMADAITLLDRAGGDMLSTLRSKLAAIHKGRTYSKRLLYIRIAWSCWERLSPAMFDRLFVDDVLSLARDPITNVRFCCARFLSESLCPSPRYRQHQGLRAAVERLRNDEDDVEIRRFFVSAEQIEEWLRAKRAAKLQRAEEERAQRQREEQRQRRSSSPPSTSRSGSGDAAKSKGLDALQSAALDEPSSTDSSLYSSSSDEDGGKEEQLPAAGDGVGDGDGDGVGDDEEEEDALSSVDHELDDIGRDLRENKLSAMEMATIGTNELSTAQKEQQLLGAAPNQGLIHQDTPRHLVIPEAVLLDEDEEEQKHKEQRSGPYGLEMDSAPSHDEHAPNGDDKDSADPHGHDAVNGNGNGNGDGDVEAADGDLSEQHGTAEAVEAERTEEDALSD